ncbi:LapA family protein [Polaromonas sp.]|uniref:LapA family protein n=1 Tax=Polaromonas sp. TaxID=1869339 RepID=UPI002FC73641
MKYLMWLLKAAIFFTLFAFALNNQQAVSVYFFFGTLWQAPLVLVVLIAFTAGLALGILVMMPRWWKKRRNAHLNASHGHTTVTDNPSTFHHGI